MVKVSWLWSWRGGVGRMWKRSAGGPSPGDSWKWTAGLNDQAGTRFTGGVKRRELTESDRTVSWILKHRHCIDVP